MVDPLVSGPTVQTDLSCLLPKHTIVDFTKALVTGAFLEQARTHLPEWTLAMSEDIYSRYLVSPVRDQKTGDAALCGSSLGAFGGFLCEEYREHDFRLGRYNCQKFLRTHFALPKTALLFKNWVNSPQYSPAFETFDSQGNCFLPIIPLVGPSVTTPEPLPAWPSGAFRPKSEQIYDLLEQRIEAIYEHAVQELGWCARTYLRIAWLKERGELYRLVRENIEQELQTKNLY